MVKCTTMLCCSSYASYSRYPYKQSILVKCCFTSRLRERERDFVVSFIILNSQYKHQYKWNSCNSYSFVLKYMFNTLVANQRKSKYTTLLHMIEPNTLGIYTWYLSFVVTPLKFDSIRDESISTKCCWTNQISITLSWLSFKLYTSLRIINPKNKNKVNLSLKRFEAYCWRTPTIQVFQISRRKLMVQIMIST